MTHALKAREYNLTSSSYWIEESGEALQKKMSLLLSDELRFRRNMI
ncbi:hypothetical protein Golob_013580 [Gossypium lobatum]|uniref:Uncharacterized protein n=1 Tax=Gossypium lobatum TaxID=34289 RepID=A0A7J8LPU7_9ROSI|nr:hypothetical protein [Gossypium lobatum]